MAQAKQEWVEVPIQETIVEERITLTLTRQEAETLQVVCAMVGGDPGLSPRGDMDSIWMAIGEYLPNYRETEAYQLITRGSNIYFKDR